MRHTLIIFYGLFFSLQLTAQKVVGLYRWDGIYGIQVSIEFKKDHTFIYTWDKSDPCGETIGTWRTENDSIIVRSINQPKKYISDQTYQLNTFNNDRQKFLAINIQDYYGEPIKGVICAHEAIKSKSDSLGTCILQNTSSIDSLRLTFPNNESIDIALKPNANTYNIRLLTKCLEGIYFDDVIFYLKEDKLYAPGWLEKSAVEEDHFDKIR
mgnify:CR=1 FL=1